MASPRQMRWERCGRGWPAIHGSLRHTNGSSTTCRRIINTRRPSGRSPPTRACFTTILYPVRARAELELDRGNADAATRIYDSAFQPLWPDDMTKSWFQLLDEQHRLRDFVGRARAALQTDPADLNATARLFHYFLSQNNAPAARRALLDFRLAKESGSHPWTPDELLITAQLFERLPDVNEAARLWYALYSVPAADAAHQERALYELSNLLLTQADQPIRFGSGDLSFYKDVAAIDPSPGFLNGILSLILNGAGPRWAYREQNGKAAAVLPPCRGERAGCTAGTALSAVALSRAVARRTRAGIRGLWRR